MRTFLTFIAVFLVVALSAALVAPLFVDWSSHRGQIEAELGQVLGAKIRVSGPIDIRILPTPYLQLKNVTIAEASGNGAPTFVCESVRLEAALASLAGGRIRFTLARLDHPLMTLARAADGAIAPPRWRLEKEADRVALDRVVVTGGRLKVTNGAGSAALDVAGIDLDASAVSLNGPYRGSGRFSTPEGLRAEFRFAAGALADSSLPIKFEIDPADGRPGGVFDGALTFARRAGASGVDLGYVGAASVFGDLALMEKGPRAPWRASGALRGDVHGATLANGVLRIGPDERALEASGAARIELGPNARLTVDLKAKQLNIDALLREKGADSVSPARALAALATAWSPFDARGAPPMALRIAFATPTVIVGAQTLTDVALDATATAGAPIEGELALGLPGRSTLRLVGSLELGSAAQFKGRLEAQLGDFARLREWAARDEPKLAERLSALGAALPYGTASASGDVEASAVGFSARNLHLVVDRTALNGALAFTRALDASRGRLFMDLRSDLLDVDALPDLRASADLLGDIDLSLEFDAAKLRVARVGGAAVEGGSLSLKASKTGDQFSLDRFSVAGLGGANVDGRGGAGPGGTWLTLRLDAERLRDFATLVARVAPGRLSRLLLQRADALSPARAAFEARATPAGAAGGVALDSLKAQGSAGQTRFTLEAQRAGGAPGVVAATFALDAPEAGGLLEQFGSTVAAPASEPARVEASLNGRWESGYDARLAASIAGADLAWRGRIRPEAAGDDAQLFGSATVKSSDIMPLLAALGVGAPTAAPTVPVDLATDMVVRDARLDLPHLSGTVANARVAGRLDWRPAVEPIAAASLDPDVALAQKIAGEPPVASDAQIHGELSFDRASLAALFSLPLGVPQPASAGAKWSSVKFAPPLVDAPPLDIRLKVAALEVVDGLEARAAAGRLTMDHGKFDIDDFAMDFGAAHASGRLSLRRDRAIATLSGQVSLDAPSAERAGLRGGFEASLAFASTGQDANALMSGMVGEGKVVTLGAAIPRLDPGALGRVLANVQTPDARIDETNIEHALGIELDRGPMKLPDGEAPAIMNAGIVHVGSLNAPQTGAIASASADFDLRSRDLTIRATFAEAAGGKFWNGPPPSIAVVVTRSLESPEREIDAAGFAAGLAAQAIARESDHIAALEADIRERAYFNRLMKAEQFMRRREAELDAYEAEQEILKSERERKRAEDEAVKAGEERAKAIARPAPDVTPLARPTAAPQPAVTPRVGASQPDPTASGLY